MKIAVLSHKDVGSWYEAKLLEMGHETMSGGGAVHAPMLKGFLECDGCLLLGEEDDLKGSEMNVAKINWIKYDGPTEGMEVFTKS